MYVPIDLVAEARRTYLMRDAARARETAQSRPRARDRLTARWRRHRLDRTLAGEAVLPARARLALRARTLVEPGARAELARQLRRVVDDANRGERWPGFRIRPRRADVLAAAPELDVLADRLLAPGGVSARGVAQVRLLLTDGTGPLYRRGASEELRAAVARALAGLQPEPER
jgi:hypothetical protein